MASPEADSRVALLVSGALDKIIKNASWRKHSKLAHECKLVIEKMGAPSGGTPDSESENSPPGPLQDGAFVFSLSESETILSPLIGACSSGVLKIVDPALDCIQKLIVHGHIRGEADTDGNPEAKLLFQLVESVCKCHDLGDDNIELLVLRTLLSAVTSTSLRIHGDCLLQVVRTSYDIYLGSKNVVNQTTAKASLIQMLVIVFRRMEADSSTVPVQPIVVAELMEPADKSGSGDANMTQFVQGFITKIIQDIDGVLNPAPSLKSLGGHDGAFETAVETTNPTDLLDSTDKDMLDAKYWEISMYKTALEGRKGELADGEGDRDDEAEVQIGNKLRRDAFLVFRALCKLSMKTPPKDGSADPLLMRGKIVALELLKILLENAGAIFRTSERFLGAIKQYLCLSLLKNSASTLMIIFQLSCSIFISLVSRFRAGLKAEIGVFFPMIVLRVLENVAQPNFQQKMIVLRFMEKLCVNSQILVDIFINYDCDVHSSNIFERIVNGLLKTAQGVPPGVATTLLPPQEYTLKVEAMKCLVAILRSMGDWMNKQLRIPDSYTLKSSESEENNREGTPELPNGDSEKPTDGVDSHSEPVSEVSEAAALEQRRAYKLELQEGILLFNQKPRKGIEFLIKADKVGDSPEEIASFLKNASGLNKTLIGDYLGEREELSLKVMHAYVDSFDFQGFEFDEAIRCLLQGFRLPGEAQKIDRIMEKFAERYCKCNPKEFASADTAYVLAYSVIMLNTDAHNPTVKNKMSQDDFIRNNRGIDDGKDLPEEYLRSLFERISRNEIKMKEDELTSQHRYSTNSNRILGLDSILNIVIRKRGEEKTMETSDDLIRHMQEQFKEKARKSEFEHLHLLGEGAPPDAAFFAVPQNDLDKSKQSKSTMLPVLKKKGPGRQQYPAAAARRGSYDSAGVGGDAFGMVTSEQMNNLVSNLNLLEQVGEMNRIFIRSQKLNSEAIVDFVKALCKVSMEELRSASNPRVFSLTKIVEIAHYNMNRIRLVWSSIWHVLGDFFVNIGCSENLSIAIFAMDSLRQLAMKFLEREELANYNFQNEFMKPFVIVMRKSSAVEIRELIIRCVSQMVLARVNNVKSGWKSMFMVFTTAAYDDHKNIVLLAFEIIEKIVREYFPYITETETTTFTDCVNCLIAFTNSRFNKDISLNAIGFLRFCAAKLAEGDLGSSMRNKDTPGKPASLSPRGRKEGKADTPQLTDKDDHLYFWFPLLAGLSELSFDPRPEIRKSALQVLFDTLRNHGHLFSLPLWERVFDSVLFPIFDYVRHAIDPSGDMLQGHGLDVDGSELDQDAWLYETCTLALQLVVDLFVKFYNSVNPLLKKVLMLLISFIKRPHQSLAGIGIAAFVRLMSHAGGLFSEDKWLEVVLSLKEATTGTLPDFSKVLDEINNASTVSSPDDSTIKQDESSGSMVPDDDMENSKGQSLYLAISNVKCRTAVQLLLIQAIMEIYNMYRSHLSAKNSVVLFDALHVIASHAHKINSDGVLRSKLQDLGSMTQMQDPPLLRLENESYQICLTLLQNLILDKPVNYGDVEAEAFLIDLCKEVLHVYLDTAQYFPQAEAASIQPRWLVPLGSARRRELAARAPLIVATLHAVTGLEESSFEKNLAQFFPLLCGLISCEHGSGEVQVALGDMLNTWVGPILLRSC
ncbi:unnamed protein product [Victoria cruziana]